MTSNQPLLNQIALVTGSSRGIGKEIAIKLAHNGADLVINYVRNEQPALETAKTITDMGRRAVVIRANIGKMDGLEKLFEFTKNEYGKLDIFIHNAASGFNHPALEQKEKGWNWTMDVNAKAFLFGAQMAAPLFDKQKGGVMVAISSQGSQRVLPDYISVGASKAALESLTRYLAVELAPLNIRVNAVSPGLVETDALKHFSVMQNLDVIEKTAAITPAGKLVTPKDVAETVVFLCDSKSDMIRGQVIVIDGGFSLLVPNSA